MRALADADFVNGDDVGMIERRSRLCLLLEAPHALGISRKLSRQELERYFAIEPRVERQMDFAHAAASERSEQLVSTELAARLQVRHGLTDIFTIKLPCHRLDRIHLHKTRRLLVKTQQRFDLAAQPGVIRTGLGQERRARFW